MRIRGRSTPGRERGSMAVEIVILVPVMLMFLMLIVEAGRFVAVRGDLEATTRDAARAASLERSEGAGLSAARSVVAASLDDDVSGCGAPTLGGSNFVAGGMVQVNLSCDVPLDGLGLLNIGLKAPISVHSTAPIDTYRRTG